MQSPPRICVVEDDDSVRSALESFVRSLGYAVEAFASAEAYLASDWTNPDCMICDVQMPGMSGVDLFQQLRERGGRVPTIFVTAFAQDRVRQLAGKDVLVFEKPFDGAVLAEGLQAILR